MFRLGAAGRQREDDRLRLATLNYCTYYYFIGRSCWPARPKSSGQRAPGAPISRAAAGRAAPASQAPLGAPREAAQAARADN